MLPKSLREMLWTIRIEMWPIKCNLHFIRSTEMMNDLIDVIVFDSKNIEQ